MAHEIELLATGPAMFYAGETPWHGLGTRVPAAVPSAEAITLAGLDWEVETVAAYGDDQLAEGHVAIRRATDRKVFGFASPRYQPIQNRDMFAFGDALVQDGVMLWETGMSLKGGRRVAMVARMAEDWRIAGDQHYTYIAIIGEHTAQGAVYAFPTSVRVVCNNTAELALAEGAARGVRITHYGDVADKLAQAKQLLQVTTEQQRRYQEWLRKLAETEVRGAQVHETAAALFGSLDEATSTQRRNSVERFLDMYRGEATDGQGPTGYSLLQAVTGFGNYGPRSRSAEGRFLSVLEGPGAEFMRKGAGVVERVTGVTRSAPENRELVPASSS